MKAKMDFLMLCGAVIVCDAVSDETKAEWRTLRTNVVGFDIGSIFG